MPEIHLVPCWEADEECSGKDRTISISYFPFVIGRASWCDHRIDHPMISRQHCVISFRDGQIWIEDLASANGTRLNGEPVLAPCPVVDGALIQLAHLPFVVQQSRGTVQTRLAERSHGVSPKENGRDPVQLPNLR
jgi:pSer/pThr/pTyr-binding forkhead associated (FHA) protein